MENQYPLLKNGVYLKSASIAAMHNSVIEEISHWNHSISHFGGINEKRFFDLLMDVHDTVSNFIGASQEDVTILENSSHNMNIIAMMLQKEKQEGKKEILLVADEFPTSVLPFYHHDFDIVQVPTQRGKFTLKDFEERITKETCAIVCSVIQFSTGQYTCPSELSKLCQKYGIHLILNTTQSLGVYPLNLKDLHVSALTSSCHKWLGAGIGGSLLYLSSEFRKGRKLPLAGWCSVADPFALKNERPIPRDATMALQLGSLPFPVLAGIAQACRQVNSIGQEIILKKVLSLSNFLTKELNKRGIQTLGNGQSGIVTFSPQGDGEEIVAKMEDNKIYVNCRRGLIRVSPHHYNSEKDIELFLASLDKFS